MPNVAERRTKTSNNTVASLPESRAMLLQSVRTYMKDRAFSGAQHARIGDDGNPLKEASACVPDGWFTVLILTHAG